MSDLTPEAAAKAYHRCLVRAIETSSGMHPPKWNAIDANSKKDLVNAMAQFLVNLTAFDPPFNDGIDVESGVSLFDGHPYITMRWGKERAQFSPEELRDHAIGLLQASEAADTDARIFRALSKGGETEMAQMLISLLRLERSTPFPNRPEPPKEQ